VGIDKLLQTERTLYFLDEHRRISTMRAAPLPAPLHLFPSFLSARYLTVGDKLRIAWGMLSLMWSERTSNQSFKEWLLAHRQTTRTIDRFWGLVLVSALNETIDRMDFRYARQVFVEGFLQNGLALYVEIPRVPLGQFYGELLEEWLRCHSVDLRLNSAVEELMTMDGCVTGGRLKDGSIIEAEATILAVTHHRVTDLLPSSLVEREPSLKSLLEIETSPITSVHLWYDRPVMKEPHLVVVGRKAQWLFRRTWDQGGYVQAVISASRELSTHGNDEILRIIQAEVEEMLPEARRATLLHSRVVTERRATFSVLPGIDRLRPGAKTSIHGLYLAGDFTQTGWPATMEGAVRSGYLAAAAVSGSSQSPQEGLEPSLPASWLYPLLGGRC
jgi:squalene-associated FAD-dependent desaturase